MTPDTIKSSPPFFLFPCFINFGLNHDYISGWGEIKNIWCSITNYNSLFKGTETHLNLLLQSVARAPPQITDLRSHAVTSNTNSCQDANNDSIVEEVKSKERNLHIFLLPPHSHMILVSYAHKIQLYSSGLYPHLNRLCMEKLRWNRLAKVEGIVYMVSKFN